MSAAVDEARLKQERVASLQAQMKQRQVGALYLTDTVNVRYVVGTKIPGGAVFVPPAGEPLAFVRPRDMGYVKLKHGNVRTPFYASHLTWERQAGGRLGEFGNGIAELMGKHGVAGEELGVDTLDSAGFLALSEAGIRIADALPALELARSVKTRDEVQIYRELGSQYSETVSAFRAAIRPGISENELAAVVVSAFYAAGGEEVSQLNVCSADNMNPWRRWPTQRQLEEGEFVGIDLHGRGASGLRGDASRTFFVGERPSAGQRDLYHKAYDYLVGSSEAFQAGRSYAEAMEQVPEVPGPFQPQMFNYSIAHCLGMTPSGYPTVDKDKPPLEDVLKANQVLAIECYFGEEGSPEAVKLEEMILVREGSPERLGAAIPFDERLDRKSTRLNSS